MQRRGDSEVVRLYQMYYSNTNQGYVAKCDMHVERQQWKWTQRGSSRNTKSEAQIEKDQRIVEAYKLAKREQ